MRCTAIGYISDDTEGLRKHPNPHFEFPSPHAQIEAPGISSPDTYKSPSVTATSVQSNVPTISLLGKSKSTTLISMTSPLILICPQANKLQSANMPPHFTTLPREIRDAILEMCLVVGTIDPYRQKCGSAFRKSARKPDISLLAVNKAINVEAAEIFYSKNVWVINRSFKDDGQREEVSQAPTDEIWHTHRNQIRHVHMSLDLDELEVKFFNLVSDMAYQKPPNKTLKSVRMEGGDIDRESLITDLCRWKMNVCRELGVKSLTIDLPPPLDWTYSPSEKVLWRCCLDPLLDWVRKDEEIRVGEPDPASVRSDPPKITLTGCSDILRTFRQGWKEQWGPLNHSVKGDRHCLEGFFQPRDANTIGKTGMSGTGTGQELAGLRYQFGQMILTSKSEGEKMGRSCDTVK